MIQDDVKNFDDNKAWELLRDALAALKLAQPNDRSEKDRYYAICITDLEKVLSLFYFSVFVEGVSRTPNDA